MADDQPLIRAADVTFWEITKYKPGQRLNMSDPRDRELSKTWLDIYRQIRGHRDRATARAQRTLNETVTPHILVVERNDGSLRPQAFPRRSNLDVLYDWLADQPEAYVYLAAFDFTQNREGPVRDQFAAVKRWQATRTRAAASGWF